MPSLTQPFRTRTSGSSISRAHPTSFAPPGPIIEAAATAGSVFVSIISVWEIALLVCLNHLSLHTTVHRWVDEALGKPGIHLLPLTPEIVITSVESPGPSTSISPTASSSPAPASNA